MATSTRGTARAAVRTASRTTAFTIAVLACVLAGACHTNKATPAAGIDLAGEVRSQGTKVKPDHGAPLARTPVVLSRDLAPSDQLAATSSAGPACLDRNPPAPCRSGSRQATTDGRGHFEFTLKGTDALTTFGPARRVIVATRVAPSGRQADGASVSARLVLPPKPVTVPVLRLWDASTVVTGKGTQLTATWDVLPGAGYGTLRQYQLIFADRRGRPVWSFPTTKPSVDFDVRLLEDGEGVVATHALAGEPGPATTIDLDYRAPTRRYESAAGAPISRGAPCALGSPAGSPLSPCPLTDGDFTSTLDHVLKRGAVQPPGQRSPSSTTVPASVPVVIDTNGVRPMGLVVVRGCAPSCQVDVSANGVGWAPIGKIAGDGAVVPAGGTAVARYVRVSTPTGLTGLGSLREVSVWDQNASTPSGAAQPGVTLLPPRSRAGAEHRAPLWLRAMALLLLLALVAAIVRLLTFRPLWRARSGG